MWRKIDWTDVHSGRCYKIRTTSQPSSRTARVKSYRDVLDEYRAHPEPKSAAADGSRCDRATVGLLQRRQVQSLYIFYVGKESNRLDDVEQGLVHDWDDVQERYDDPGCDPLSQIKPVLRKIPRRQLAEDTGVTEREIRYLLNGCSRPKPATWRALVRVAASHPDS